ncbi:hypothetical protein AB4298_06850, partial [Shewanella sp. 10N.261.52.F9]|uniref:hypothetical protein n=1 Tax=Shewanella sp. 10N.261.52.F9 TaxID=3229684 RepID=UPI00354F14D3
MQRLNALKSEFPAGQKLSAFIPCIKLRLISTRTSPYSTCVLNLTAFGLFISPCSFGHLSRQKRKKPVALATGFLVIWRLEMT